MAADGGAPVRETVEEVVAMLAAEPHTLGVLFYGSAVSGNEHPDSDLDFLCLTGADWYAKELRRVRGREVEVQRLPASRVRQEMGFTPATNHNFMLNVLTSGRVMYDRGGTLAGLVAEARAIREAGPPAPSLLELQMGATYFRHHLAELDRVERAGDPDGLFRVLADLLFHNALHSYCRTHRRWALKFTYLIADVSAADPAFGALCRAYLRAGGNAERLEATRAIVEAVMAPTGWPAAEYETPRASAEQVGRLAAGFV